MIIKRSCDIRVKSMMRIIEGNRWGTGPSDDFALAEDGREDAPICGFASRRALRAGSPRTRDTYAESVTVIAFECLCCTWCSSV